MRESWGGELGDQKGGEGTEEGTERILERHGAGREQVDKVRRGFFYRWGGTGSGRTSSSWLARGVGGGCQLARGRGSN